jgi:hypothetical protein
MAFSPAAYNRGGAGTITFQIEPAWSGGEDSVRLFLQIREPLEWHSRLLLFKDHGYLRYLLTDDRREHGVAVPIVSWAPGDRHMVTATWHDGTLALYVDAKLVGQDVYHKGLEITQRTLLFMGSESSAEPARAAEANLTRVMIYGRALEPAEVP